MPLGISSKASNNVRGRWEGEVERQKEEHPSLKVETLRTLAARRVLGVCGRLRRVRHRRAAKNRLLELQRRKAIGATRDHAWERVDAYTAPDPAVRAILEEIARMHEAECARLGIARAGSHSDAKNAILEDDAGDFTRSGTGSDGHLPRNPLHGPDGQDTPRVA